MATLLQQLRAGFHDLSPLDYWHEQSWRAEAAVLLAFTREADPQLVLTKRSMRLSSHKGEVALPGGKIDPTDRDVIETALREAEEEVFLPRERVEVLGHLDPMVSRFGVKVTPVVGLIEPEQALSPNYDELDSIFKVPLSFFVADKRLRTDRGTVSGFEVAVPAWQWQQYEIWGVTAVIMVNFMNRVLGANISTGIEQLAQETDGRVTPKDWIAS